MPRYYFDIHDGIEVRDEIGREIESPLALRREALRVVTRLTAEEGEDSEGFTLVLSVRDSKGSIVLTLRTVCQIEHLSAQPLQAAS